MMNAQTRRPFELDGEFFPGHVKHRDRRGRVVKRRMLCFVRRDNSVVGASASFSRAEAYHAASRSTVPDPQPSKGLTLAVLLKARGFPIHSPADQTVEIDDRSAEAVRKEFS